MSLKLPLGGFNWDEATSQFNEDFINICNKNSHIGYFIETDFQYPEKLLELDNDLPFLPEKIRIEKVEKLAVNLHDKKEYSIHIKNLEQTLNHRLVLRNCIESLNLIKKLR